MTQEEEQLVLKVLCEELPYELKVDHFGVVKELLGIIPPCFPEANIMVGYDINDYEDTIIEDIKPYLRPMSSLTDKENKEVKEYLSSIEGQLIGFSQRVVWVNDYCLSHHIDTRHLIEKGLALEAPEGMYKNE